MQALALNKGYFKGQTINLAGVKFVNGVADLSHVSVADFVGLHNYLSKCYQAEISLDGKCTFEADKPERTVQDVPSGIYTGGRPTEASPDDSGTDAKPKKRRKRVRAKGNGQESAEAEVNE